MAASLHGWKRPAGGAGFLQTCASRAVAAVGAPTLDWKRQSAGESSTGGRHKNRIGIAENPLIQRGKYTRLHGYINSTLTGKSCLAVRERELIENVWKH